MHCFSYILHLFLFQFCHNCKDPKFAGEIHGRGKCHFKAERGETEENRLVERDYFVRGDFVPVKDDPVPTNDDDEEEDAANLNLHLSDTASDDTTPTTVPQPTPGPATRPADPAPGLIPAQPPSSDESEEGAVLSSGSESSEEEGGATPEATRKKFTHKMTPKFFKKKYTVSKPDCDVA
jgi:hypothetical protein